MCQKDNQFGDAAVQGERAQEIAHDLIAELNEYVNMTFYLTVITFDI